MSSKSSRSFSFWGRSLTALLLLLLASCIIWQRWHTYTEPLDNDVSLYAINGHAVLQGQVLYRDVWEIKPPGTIYTFAAVEALTGYGEQEIFALAVVAALLTLLGVYRAGNLAYGRTAGLVAAGCWTIVNADPFLEANKPNVEVLMNAALVWLLVGFLRLPARAKPAQLLILGLLGGLATLYKQFLLINLLLLLAAHLAWPRTDEPNGTLVAKRGLSPAAQGALVAGGFAAVWLLTLGGMAVTGGLGGFLSILTVIGKTYAGNPLANLLTGLFQAPPFAPATLFLWPLIGLTLFFVAIGWRWGNRRQWGLLLAAIIATQLSVSMPGRFFSHYYQLWLPVLCVGAGWGVGLLRQRFHTQPARWLAPAVGLALVGLLLAGQAPYYRLSAEEWSLKKYGPLYLETKKLGLEIKDNLPATESIYEWGMESGIYFYSQRRRACGLDWAGLTPRNTIIDRNPLYPEWTKRYRQDLENNKPTILVVNEPLGSGENLDWLMPRYRPFPGDNRRGHFALYVRKGSGLERAMYGARP